ncbi:MAG: hypothetical protein R3F28_16825 [Candidatus Kapaibacterium sp.]|nr:hypothetical protein [Ignavibacteria bacterium]
MTYQHYIIGLIFGLLTTIGASAQHRVDRQVMGSGGGATGNLGHQVSGTLSQAAAGLLSPDGENLAGIGFWHKPFVEADALVRFPVIEAEVGTRVTIPLILDNSARLLRYGPRSFQARVRFNRSLLEPIGGTPRCTPDGDDCVMEISGTVSGNLVDTLARLEFTAMLGNAESTPLTIDTIIWERRGESEFTPRKEDGEFRLLGVCREGDHIRLIRGGGPASRLNALPNITEGPARLDVVTNETGSVHISVVDPLGREASILFDGELEAARLYQLSLDLGSLATGLYFIVMQSESERIVQQLHIRR